MKRENLPDKHSVFPESMTQEEKDAYWNWVVQCRTAPGSLNRPPRGNAEPLLPLAPPFECDIGNKKTLRELNDNIERYNAEVFHHNVSTGKYGVIPLWVWRIRQISLMFKETNFLRGFLVDIIRKEIF